MTGIAWIVVGVLAALFLVQAAATAGFVRVLLDGKGQTPDDADCPKAVVVLCLRGDDPFLPDCLNGLLTQDYPHYDVRIVVDQRQDPAWEVVEQLVARHQARNVRVEPLAERLDSCSLKGSSIVQAVNGLDGTYEVVAFLDADTVAHPTWLRELVAPLSDGRVGVASGNRWYMPAEPTWGALTRYIWNAAGVVQMYWNRFTWGGSVALRAEIACHRDLISRWKTALSTDTVILDVVRRHGFEARFVPSLMMTNRESCDLPGFFDWVQRQMIVARLYHRGWTPILVHGIVMTAVPLAALGALAAALVGRQWEAAAWIGASALGYWFGMGLLVVLLEQGVRRVVRLRGEPTGWATPGAVLKGFFALPLTQVVYAAALGKARFMRTVRWRGVSYRVEGPRRVRLIEYQPYQSDPRPTDSATSL